MEYFQHQFWCHCHYTLIPHFVSTFKYIIFSYLWEMWLKSMKYNEPYSTCKSFKGPFCDPNMLFLLHSSIDTLEISVFPNFNLLVDLPCAVYCVAIGHNQRMISELPITKCKLSCNPNSLHVPIQQGHMHTSTGWILDFDTNINSNFTVWTSATK